MDGELCVKDEDLLSSKALIKQLWGMGFWGQVSILGITVLE